MVEVEAPDFATITIGELRKLAVEYGVSGAGTKAEIIERINAVS